MVIFKNTIQHFGINRCIGMGLALVTAALAWAAPVIAGVGDEAPAFEAKAFINKYGKMSPQMQAALAKLTSIPVDIRPEYTVLKKMKSWVP